MKKEPVTIKIGAGLRKKMQRTNLLYEQTGVRGHGKASYFASHKSLKTSHTSQQT